MQPRKQASGETQLCLGLSPIGDHVAWTPLPKLTVHHIEIRVQRQPDGSVRVRGFLDGGALPNPEDAPALPQEEQLRMLQIDGFGIPVWLDEFQMRRKLPHDPWFLNPLDKQYYALSPRSMTAENARAYARARGGDLAILKSAEQRRWAEEVFGRNDFLVGLHRVREPGAKSAEWRWVDDDPASANVWPDARCPVDPEYVWAGLGDYGPRHPFTQERPARMFGVSVSRRLPAILSFPEKPSRLPRQGKLGFGCLGGDLDWARSLGGSPELAESHHTASVEPDRDPRNPGGLIVTGTFVKSAVFGSRGPGSNDGPLAGTAAGATDVFVAKYDAQGRILWARLFGGTEEDESAGLAVDRRGRIFVAGTFRGRAGFRESVPAVVEQGPTLQSEGGGDFFVLCVQPDGQLAWMRRLGGPDEERASGIAIADGTGIYATGTTTGTGQTPMVLGSPASVLQSVPTQARGQEDILLVSLSPAGDYRWMCREGGARSDHARAICVRSDGAVVITGAFEGQATFGREGDPLRQSLRSDAAHQRGSEGNLYIACYSGAGSLLWCRHHGGPGGKTTGLALTSDASGNVYLAGGVHQVVYLGNGSATYPECAERDLEIRRQIYTGPDPTAAKRRLEQLMPCESMGWVDIFLARYDRSGKPVWGRTAKGADAENGAYGLAWSPDGSLLLTGRIQGACVFGEAEPYQCIRSSYGPKHPDVVVARYRADNGKLVWARTARGPCSNWGTDVAVLDGKRAVVVGGFQGPLNFGEGEPEATTLVGGAVFMAAFRMRDGAPGQPK